MHNRTYTAEENRIFQLLKGVIDPELMVNIYDLGLIYDVRLNNTSNQLEVDITLTSPGCPMGDVILSDVKHLLEANYREYSIHVNLVWEPAWTKDRITPDGQKILSGDTE